MIMPKKTHPHRTSFLSEKFSNHSIQRHKPTIRKKVTIQKSAKPGLNIKLFAIETKVDVKNANR